MSSDASLEALQAVCRASYAAQVSIFGAGWGRAVKLAFPQAAH